LKVLYIESLLELDNDAGHIVATNTARRGNIRCDDLIEDLFDSGRDLFYLLLEELAELIDSLLRSEAVPDSVASND